MATSGSSASALLDVESSSPGILDVAATPAIFTIARYLHSAFDAGRLALTCKFLYALIEQLVTFAPPYDDSSGGNNKPAPAWLKIPLLIGLPKAEYNFKRFYACCWDGDVELARWLVKHGEVRVDESTYKDGDFWEMICVNNRFELAKLIASISPYKSDAADLWYITGPESCCWWFAFCDVCEHGNLEFAQWMAKHFGLTRARIDEEQAKKGEIHNDVLWDSFTPAWEKGNLKLAQWLVEHFKLKKEDLWYTKSNNWSYSFRDVCKLVNLEIAQWMAKHFNLTRALLDEDQAKDSGTYIDNLKDSFRFACEKGNVKFAQWLAEHFKLGKEDLGLTKHRAIFRSGCSESGIFNAAMGSGNVEFVEWLYTYFKLYEIPTADGPPSDGAKK